MMFRTLATIALLLTTILSPSLAWSIGIPLTQTKKELHLDYEIKLKDQNAVSASVEVALRDQGRLTEITGLQLLIPDQTGNNFDVVVPVAPKVENGITYYRFQLSKSAAERGKLHLIAKGLDGKKIPGSYCFFEIPLKEEMAEKKKSESVPSKP